MEMMILILALSTVGWYIVDRFKQLWENVPKGKYITIACSAIMGFGLTFGFGIDLIFATGLFPTITVAGQILTALAIMSGSSGIAEIIALVKGLNKN